ncbi:MAG: type II toxin-antitoxin system RelE/ParE family toxin [Thermovirgaceae bacterium]|nr:type II toxin-antitoxin system RelE/ParE family toxin [Thermovirgaceae bacterium]
MGWTVNYTRTAVRDLGSLPGEMAGKIVDRIDDVALSENPRTSGKNLSGNLAEYWRYRVGNFRVICSIKDSELEILVIKIGDRKQIYRDVRRMSSK